MPQPVLSSFYEALRSFILCSKPPMSCEERRSKAHPISPDSKPPTPRSQYNASTAATQISSKSSIPYLRDLVALEL